MKNRRRYVLGVLVAIAAGALLWRALRPEPNPAIPHAHEHEEPHGHDPEGPEDGHGQEGEGDALELKDALLLESGISLDTVRSRRLSVRLPLQGKIVLNEDRAVHVHPRFPGVILEVRKQLGSRVRKGEVLAVIESNENLQPYSVISRMEGTVVGRHASVGESVSAGDELFTVADLSTVWVDFQVYRQDFAKLRVGQRVRLAAQGLPATEVRLAYLSPSTETHSQSLLARAELSNSGGAWTPGLFVQGEAAVEEFTALSVRLDAVQQLAQGPVIFAREHRDHYAARPVRLGRRDGEFVELAEGPNAGTVYVARNSFVLKAELGKGEAGHDH
jgi:cobalt-zinc-cadmium efflux system membrane fusion protein